MLDIRTDSEVEKWKNLTELSLFTGGGGGLIATSLFMGIRTIGMVEFNEDAQNMLLQRQKDNMLDKCPIFGDIREFIKQGFAESYKGMVDLVTGGFPCFTSGHLVITKTGPKPIEDIELGEYVLTHRERWRKVIGTLLKKGASTRILTGDNFNTIEGTPEHPFFTKFMYSDWTDWTEFQYLEKEDNLRILYLSKDLSEISGKWTKFTENREGRTNQTVYNLEVEEDNSYTVNNIVVHNCQPFSSSGQRAAQNDPRNMWPSTREVIRIVQPRFFFLENVANLLHFPYIQQIFGEMAEIGYNVAWTVLSAKDIGAFHGRNRIWFLGQRGNDSNS